MAKAKEHYSDFKPVVAVLYDGTNHQEIQEIYGPHDITLIDPTNMMCLLNPKTGLARVKVGMWLVKHEDGRATVQEVEPSWVENWDWCVGSIDTPNPNRFARVLSEPVAYREVSRCINKILYKRPVIRINPNIDDFWVGLWNAVE